MVLRTIVGFSLPYCRQLYCRQLHFPSWRADEGNTVFPLFGRATLGTDHTPRWSSMSLPAAVSAIAAVVQSSWNKRTYQVVLGASTVAHNSLVLVSISP